MQEYDEIERQHGEDDQCIDQRDYGDEDETGYPVLGQPVYRQPAANVELDELILSVRIWTNILDVGHVSCGDAT